MYHPLTSHPHLPPFPRLLLYLHHTHTLLRRRQVYVSVFMFALATYVAFCDFSTAFPSIHRGKLLSVLCKENFVGRMWKHLRERFQVVKVRVLHPRIPTTSSVDILRGVSEGSRLSPTLSGIFVADLIRELKTQFSNANITHNGGFRWIGGILYVDDLCLISTDAHELQMMINTCQTWSEKARMELNADKTKVM